MAPLTSFVTIFCLQLDKQFAVCITFTYVSFPEHEYDLTYLYVVCSTLASLVYIIGASLSEPHIDGTTGRFHIRIMVRPSPLL